jgi:hypothetical protein
MQVHRHLDAKKADFLEETMHFYFCFINNFVV